MGELSQAALNSMGLGFRVILEWLICPGLVWMFSRHGSAADWTCSDFDQSPASENLAEVLHGKWISQCLNLGIPSLTLSGMAILH